MTRWIEQQYLNYMARWNEGATGNSPPEADEGPESRLQGKIQKWARDWGHPCLSLHMSKNAKGFITPGWPDICLILPKRVLFIELKAKSGWLSEEQKQMRLQFMHHGHEIHEVRSFKRFLELVQGDKS